MKKRQFLAALLSSAMVIGTITVPVFAEKNVAKIGSTNYTTLEAAFDAAKDGETITVLYDCNGNGIKVPQDKYTSGLTVDFGGHTYTVDGTLVGSKGTETLAFQLLKGNTITFQNGTLIPGNENIKRIIQNYSNLTLDKMTIDMSDPAAVAGVYDCPLSFNNGTSVIRNSVIKTRSEYDRAFDVYYYYKYYKDGARLTIEGDNTVISGFVVLDGDSIDIEDTDKHWLKINGGLFNGSIFVTENSDEKGISIAGGTFENDPKAYLAPGKSTVKGENGYTVNDTSSKVLLDQLNSAAANLGGDDVFTAKSEIKANGTYDQVSAALYSGYGYNVFQVSTSRSNGPFRVQLEDITGGTVITGGNFLCGLIITDIPADEFVDVSVIPLI